MTTAASPPWASALDIPELVFAQTEVFDEGFLPTRRHSWINRPELADVSQQRPYQSCVSHASARAFETMRQSRGMGAEQFDADMFHQCILDQPLNVPAMSVKQVEDHLKATGFPRATPEFQPGGQCPSPLPATVRGSGMKRIMDEETAKRALRTYWPIIALLSVEPRFEDLSGWTVYRDGIGHRTFNHAVLIIGYDADEDAWEVQNSFGLGWGAQGRGRIGYGTGGLFANTLNIAFLVY